VAALLCSLLAGAVFGQAPSDYPTLKLNRIYRGGEIITALGGNLPAVAKAYGLTGKELGELCLRDKDIRTDKTGKLFYACEGAVANAPTATNGATNALLSYPSSQTFLLHSKPGLSRVLYLDFTGHTTSGTSWNSAYTSGAAFTTPSYDTDGNSGSFSASELANIQEIWKRVSEDYAPWDVDVTTEEPPLESLRKTSSSDTAYGIRMVIGGSSYDWLGAGAGGVAYIGSYSWNSDTPAFVFPAQLGNNNKYIAEAVSHEGGHTVGLNHDGKTDGTQYYQGHNGWAPIMGVGYYANVTQFSRGEYSLANNTQDDLTVVNGYIPRSTDLVGNDIVNAVPLSGSSISVTGIVESRTDADLFRINTGGGTLSLSAVPASPDANLDIQLSLYDGSGNLVATADPAGLSCTLSTSVSSGTYYVAVDGVGVGTASTGYTDYASVGQFSLTGTVPSPLGQPPVAVVSNSAPLTGLAPLTVQFSSLGSSDPEGGALTYDWDFGDGMGSTEANPAHLYTLPGTYTASLVVFDPTGLSGSAAATVTVQSSGNIIYVSSIVMSKTASNRGTQATATVTVKDATGAVKPNVTVAGKWSGLTTTSSSGKTNSSGQVSLNSGFSKGSGTFTFTITGLTLSGATYDSSLNTLNSGSIVK
jgi:PKD repeat protein